MRLSWQAFFNHKHSNGRILCLWQYSQLLILMSNCFTKVCGGTSRVMTEVYGATTHIMMEVDGGACRMMKLYLE